MTVDDEREVLGLVERLLDEHDPATTPEREFLGHQFDAGLAWVDRPVGEGGLGLAPHLRPVVADALLASGAPSSRPRNPIGHGTAAPTIHRHGTEEHRCRLLRPLFTGEEVWCQLYSEPGAGSDLADVATRAVRDGDAWRVDGEKVWVTLGHTARWGTLIARTNPAAPKHRGITLFVVDMHAAGVEVVPLRQMTGDAEFNQVFLTDVVLTDADRLGPVDGGWGVVVEALMDERASIGGAALRRTINPIDVALELWSQASGGLGGTSPAPQRDRLVRVWIASRVNQLTSQRAAAGGGDPGPAGAIGKLAIAELNRQVYDLCVDLLGAEGLLYGSYEMTRPDEAMGQRDPRSAFLRSRANTIEGGTSEIMRNILGERVLGLPGEPRLDRDLPWEQLRRATTR